MRKDFTVKAVFPFRKINSTPAAVIVMESGAA